MKKFKIGMIGFLAVFFVNCSSKKETSGQLPYETESVYFQKWTVSAKNLGSGVDFHIQFRKPLPENSTLAKIYFQNQEGFFDKIDELRYTVRFYDKTHDLILDADSKNEYGNKAPEITQPRFELQPDQAVLEFHNGNQVQHYKIVKIKQKELLVNPSSKPGN